MQSQGVVGEVIFPNTIPPFFPSWVLFASPPRERDDYLHRLAGIRAHNRWLVDFCAEYPERRAGIGQIFLNNIDDTVEDVRFIAEHGLRGGALLPNLAPDVWNYVPPIWDPRYDRLWSACQDLDVPLNIHSGSGSPRYGSYAVSQLLYISEIQFYSTRPLAHLILSGVFERFPGLKVAMTEQGATWIRPMLEQLDQLIETARKGSAGAEMRYRPEELGQLELTASEYFRRNVWLGASMPTREDLRVREVLGPDKFMWGSDYPHEEGTFPFTKEHLRQVFHAMPEVEVRDLVGLNAAKLYGFNVAALQPLAQQFGPAPAEVATPLDALPADPNAALLKGTKSTALP
jgi:predicted TIM-barrel fold metal-dependent hydrolase